MSSARALHRPGVAAGAYPERDEAPAGRLSSWLAGCSARFGAGPLPQSRLDAFARGIRDLAAPLRAQSQGSFDAHVQKLRAACAREPVNDALLARSFALTCEAVRRSLGLELRDVQVMGGWVMARGMLAEMATGEGKTLSATLPAVAAALAGVPVHVLSSNDYLVERDATEMRPVYEALGLRVDFVVGVMQDPAARRAAYRADVCYVTAKELGFDYLRDRLARSAARQDPRAGASPELLLRGLCFAIVDEADSILIDEARTPLVLAGRGAREVADRQEEIYRTALELARSLETPRDFLLEHRARRVVLTPEGEEHLAALAEGRPGIWSGPRRRGEWVGRALSALHLHRRDEHYLVRAGRVEIVDPATGRVTPGRSWSEGLHQLVELKEGCPVTHETETLARMSYQHFFRRFLRLAGMTGTAREVAPEIRSTYGLATVRVPTHRPRRVVTRPARVHPDSEARWADVVRSVARCRESGRPVLVGTASVAASHALSERLRQADLPHAVLDAVHDADEAETVRRAGEPGRITVATRMAGRGTDIPLAPGVVEAGGLHVIAAEHAEARRIDRQLHGRCGRQGDPGSVEIVLALDEGPVRCHVPAPVLRLCEAGLRVSFLHRAATVVSLGLTKWSQGAEERGARRARRDLLLHEEALEELLIFSGAAR